MSRLSINLLLIVFLFGTVEASVDSVLIDINHEQNSEHPNHNHDHDESSSNDLDEDCNHHCHCAGQIGLAFSSSVNSVQTSVIVKISDTNLYRSSLSPPLFRPPIY
jgi:hypothetical protein